MYIEDLTQPKDAYVIVPLYNVRINAKKMPISCGLWELITKKYFYKKYGDILEKGPNHLKEDVAYPEFESSSGRPLAEYFLIKKTKLPDANQVCFLIKNSNFLRDNYIEHIKKEKIEISLLIMALRLISIGRVQINRVYTMNIINETTTSYEAKLRTSTSLDSISICKIGDEHYFDTYLLDENSLQQAIDLSPTIKKAYGKLHIPLHYFNKYFATTDLYDMVINLSIILEATILNSLKSNHKIKLTSALVSRGTRLLGSEYKKALKLLYKIRGNVVHDGVISIETKNEIKELIHKDGSTVVLLFCFIKDYFEPITRDIIKYFLMEVSKDDNKLIKAIADKI